MNIRVVEDYFTFPFQLHKYQLETIEEAVKKGSVLNRARVGEGKSVMSIYLGLYYSIVEDVEQILISMPPSLIDQWEEFLGQIEGLTDVLVYRGSPEERKEMDLTSHPVVLVSDRILVRDFKRFTEMGMRHKLFIIGDELSLKSSNQTYKCWKNLIYRRLRVTTGVQTCALPISGWRSSAPPPQP